MSNSNKSALFACSKCFKRYPYEDLSSGQQLCKECRGSYPVVKCTYCRSEFQQTDKSNTTTICKKCDQFVVQYGRPTACSYCNIIAAFIGQKCQRCANSERKYGPPITCDQCKQNCAFTRKDGDCELLDGKVLCWLCTLSFKRALAKTKKTEAEMKQLVKKRDGSKNRKIKHSNVMKLIDDSGPDFALPPPSKMHRNSHRYIDSNSSDHVVVITELKEQIAMLQKQSNQKDFQLLNKDKFITELKAKHFTTENELRYKMNYDKKEYSREVEMLHSKIKCLQKEVATLSKSGGKRSAQIRKEPDSGSGTDSPSGWCTDWRSSQHWMFQMANILFFVSYSVPTSYYGIVFMHSILVAGFLILIMWAWRIVCAPDVFTWNLCFLFINILQLIYLIYQRRPINFNPELEQVYRNMFKPFKVTRIQFKKLVSEQFAQIVTLHIGEAYAMQNLTKTDRLGLLLTGRANVLQDHQLLHPIGPCEFLDSPEFESRGSSEDKFKVSVIAATTCRYLFWQRSALEYLFVKETYLAIVLPTLVAKDITIKLYSMNNKILTDKGSYLDIRLPSITPALVSKDYKPPILKTLKKQSVVASHCPISSIPAVKITKCETSIMDKHQIINGKFDRMNLANEMGNTGVENWLEKTSKYHSLELEDDE